MTSFNGTIQPTNWLTFGGCGIKINLKTGEVVIPVGLPLSEAARAFWDAISTYYGGQSNVASASNAR